MGRGLVIIVNKVDLIENDDYKKQQLKNEIEMSFNKLFSWVRIIKLSALTGKGVKSTILENAINESLNSLNMHIKTSEFNKFLSSITKEKPHPTYKGKAIRILYGTQKIGKIPPEFILFTNGAIKPNYQRFIIKEIRKKYVFFGSPIRLVIKPKDVK
jgi:GTP-binding protein